MVEKKTPLVLTFKTLILPSPVFKSRCSSLFPMLPINSSLSIKHAKLPLTEYVCVYI